MDSLFTHFIICPQNDNNKPPLTLSLLKTPILINKPPFTLSPFPSIPQYPNSKEEVEVDDIGGLELRDVNIENAKGGIFMVDEQVEEKLDLDTEQEQQGPVIIPGLDVKREEGSIGNRENDDDDDWDSDSEDDLQIVLNNDDGHMGGMGMMDRNNNEGMGSDDEDGEDLVIVANGDHQQQTNEEQEWRDDATQGSDGERKEAGENGKANGGVVSTGGTRIGYNNHMYHPHHSQFKQWSPEELLLVLEVLQVKFVRLSMWVLLVVVVEVIGDLQGSRFLLECRILSTLLGPTPQLDEVLAADLNLHFHLTRQYLTLTLRALSTSHGVIPVLIYLTFSILS